MTKPHKLSLVTNETSRDNFLWNLYSDRVIREDLHRMYTFLWNVELTGNPGWTQVGEIERGTKELFTNENSGLTEMFAQVQKGVFFHLSIARQGMVSVTFSTEDGKLPQVNEAVAWLKMVYPPAKEDDPTSLRMVFWMRKPTGAEGFIRSISVPRWGEIETNYPQDTRRGLENVMNGFEPAHGGQLLLWHGKPGTGKTFALRALGLQWRTWCQVECVIDPEAFFGDAHYMMSVLLNNSSSTSDNWRLLILEDAGELLAEDARDRTGQGLSRLLNLADGLIGQGLKTLILVTTNEPMKKMHPAVARPGRCASEMEFKTFGQQEADNWLAERGVADRTSLPLTLAQLYGKAENFGVATGETPNTVGFKRT